MYGTLDAFVCGASPCTLKKLNELRNPDVGLCSVSMLMLLGLGIGSVVLELGLGIGSVVLELDSATCCGWLGFGSGVVVECCSAGL